MPCELRLLFGNGREKGRQVVDRVDLVFPHDFLKLFSVADIGFGCGAALKQDALGFSPLDVTGNNVAFRNHIPDFHCQLGTYLSG